MSHSFLTIVRSVVTASLKRLSIAFWGNYAREIALEEVKGGATPTETDRSGGLLIFRFQGLNADTEEK
jgi:hypothetical protein